MLNLMCSLGGEWRVGLGIGVFLFLILFYGVLTPLLIRYHNKQKREKLENKIRMQREKAEIEVMKLRAKNESTPTQSTFCQYCGAKLRDGDTHCQSCGASLTK